MRYLNQHIYCKRLKQKSKCPPDNEISAKRAWRRFNKKDTRKACYKLQQGLCAYTELRLSDTTIGHHLEHIAPRSQFPERTFSANNIVLSALSDEYAGKLNETERFAGHFKKSHYGDDWFISPYHSGCERYFQYCSHSGQILPSDTLDDYSRLKADRTITVLNLNCDYLIYRRREALEPIEKKIQDILGSLPALSQQNPPIAKQILTQLGETMLQEENRLLPEFYTAKKQLFRRYIERYNVL